jgi:hypothetical protein
VDARSPLMIFCHEDHEDQPMRYEGIGSEQRDNGSAYMAAGLEG